MKDSLFRGGPELGAPDPQQVRELQEYYLERQRPIVMIGPMAAGKSYIAMHLAKFYGYQFLDADHLIVDRYGPVSEIFDTFGEEHFRRLETEVIDEVLNSRSSKNTIFALGGGAPMTPAVAQMLEDQHVIYILVDAETVRPRITGNKSRPLLQPNPVEKWTQIFNERKATYERLAKYTLDARGGRPITEMAAELQRYVLDTRKAS